MVFFPNRLFTKPLYKFEHTIKGGFAIIEIKTNDKNLILAIQDCYDKFVINIKKQLEAKQ